MKPLQLLLFAIFLTLTTMAQADVMGGKKAKREALNMGLYPPDMIMRHQQRLGITEAQRSDITREVKTFQSAVTELQWNMQSEQQKLRESFAGYTIDADESLAQAEKVLALENRFKLAHFRMLIAIKNTLSEDQIDMIKLEIKRKRDARGGADVAVLGRARSLAAFPGGR